MRVLVAQELQRVRREIDDDQPSRRAQQPRRLADRQRRIVEIVQHLVDGDEVEAVALDRRRVDVALAHLRMGDAGLVEIGARHRQHLARHVDADAAPVERREEFQQPAGAGAEVEHRLERPLADELQQRRLDRPVGHMQRADLVPARRIGAEIVLGRPRLPAALDRGQPLEVALDLRIARVDAADDAVHEVARRVVVGDAEEGPGPLLVAVDQPGLQQQLQVARDARLRLVEDVGQVGHGQVAARQQRQDAQTAGFGRRLQRIDQPIQR